MSAAGVEYHIMLPTIMEIILCLSVYQVSSLDSINKLYTKSGSMINQKTLVYVRVKF